MAKINYSGYRFAPEIVKQAIWLYLRFTLSLVVAALGITWVLDGLEVTLAGSIAGALEASPRLRFTASDIGLVSSFYLAGAVIGALGFGWMTDRLGRRVFFFISLGLFFVFTTHTA